MLKNTNLKVVGIGACVMDTLITVPTFPKEDTKLQAESSKIAGGGPTATGIVACAKLGVPSAFLGALAEDSSGKFLLEDFAKYGVDTSLVKLVEGCRSFASTIWLAKDTASRTCVFDRGDIPALVFDKRMKKAVAQAEILMVDGNEMDAAEQACKTAKENGTKVLYDCGGLYPGVERLLKLTDVMIPSEEFALAHTKSKTVEEAAEKLFEMYRPEVVVITCGKDGGVIYQGRLDRYPAFLVDAVDTNGSGDVFHGAFAAAMVKGYGYRDCCIFASAVSALKCTGIGARESVPSEQAVYSFLKERGCDLQQS